MLDELGVDYVEGGYPGANPIDTSSSPSDAQAQGTKFTAFGMTRRPGRSASNDPGLAALLDAKADAICFVAKTWDYHVRVALETTDEENLASIRDSVRAAKAKGREVLLDCEHFFDGYKANPAYALACARAAYEAGARWVVLCDTNGGTLPHEVEKIVGEVGQAHSRRPCRHPRPQRHRAGGRQFACRRARRRAADPGHAQRPRRALRQRQSRLDHPDAEAEAANMPSTSRSASSDEQLGQLARVSHALDELLNRAPNRHAPYVGESAFATKAGIHASAIVKEPATYEHVAPETRRQQAQAAGLRPGRPLEPAGRARAHRHRGRQGRSAAVAPARRGQGARGARLRL